MRRLGMLRDHLYAKQTPSTRTTEMDLGKVIVLHIG